MAYFYRADGSVNLKRLTFSTLALVGLYSNAFLLSVRQTKDPGMDPMLQGYSQVYNPNAKHSRVMSFLLADKVLFSKVKPLPNEQSRLQGKVVALTNPYDKS